MKISPSLRKVAFILLLLAPTFLFAQNNAEKIKAKWVIDKFEVEKVTPASTKAQQDLTGMYLTFENNEMVVSQKSATGEAIIKKGPYSLSANFVTFGDDQAEIVSLTDKEMTIRIPGDGVLFFKKAGVPASE